MKKVFNLMIIFLICLNFYGCSKKSLDNYETILFNSGLSYTFFESGNYIVIDLNKLFFYDSKSNKVDYLYLDPLERLSLDESNIYRIYTTESLIYILNNSLNLKIENGIVQNEPIFTLQKIETSMFLKKDVISVGETIEKKFLGLMEAIPDLSNDSNILETSANTGNNIIRNFFIINDNLYSIENSYLHCRNLKTKKESNLIKEKINDNLVSCDGKYIYYISSINDLYIYTLENSKIEKISTNKINKFFVTEKYVYYENLSDNGYLYRIDKKTFNNIKIAEISYKEIDFDDINEYVYFTLQNDDKNLYRMKFNGEGIEKILELQNISDFKVCKNSEEIFIKSDITFSSNNQINVTDTQTIIYKMSKNCDNIDVLNMPD